MESATHIFRRQSAQRNCTFVHRLLHLYARQHKPIPGIRTGDVRNTSVTNVDVSNVPASCVPVNGGLIYGSAER